MKKIKCIHGSGSLEKDLWTVTVQVALIFATLGIIELLTSNL